MPETNDYLDWLLLHNDKKNSYDKNQKLSKETALKAFRHDLKKVEDGPLTGYRRSMTEYQKPLAETLDLRGLVRSDIFNHNYTTNRTGVELCKAA